MCLFLAGWIVLEGAVRIRAATAVDEKALRWGMWAALFASLLGPIAGLVLPGGYFFLAYGVFPFIPLRRCPAIVAHAFLFSLAARGQSGRGGHTLLWVGGATLIGLAIIGLAGWFAFASWEPTLGLAGYTGFGYALIAVGWWRFLQSRS